YGFDAFLKYHIFSGLQVSGDIAYTFAQNKTFDEPLAQVAPLLAHIGLKWEKFKYWINFRTRISAKQNRYSPSFNETETPGYTIFDFRAGVKPLKNLSIGVAVMNITDKAYYNHLNFSYKNSDENAGKIFEPGRSFSTYVKYKF
ncbi:MAG TPA: TonB-dependent receptor, partial [Bacteroidetes bacterium]|nr:TonB-dependent receptor [Bacteroidota bacterium]